MTLLVSDYRAAIYGKECNDIRHNKLDAATAGKFKYNNQPKSMNQMQFLIDVKTIFRRIHLMDGIRDTSLTISCFN
jgi:hypothetical protein